MTCLSFSVQNSKFEMDCVKGTREIVPASAIELPLILH